MSWVVHNTELAEPFAGRVAGSCVPVDGAALMVRWFRWVGVKDAIERLEGLRDAPSSEQHLIVFDLSQLREGELDAATSFARALNLRRDVLPAALHGGMLLCIPDWLERHFAAAAPDFWSVVSSAALRRGVESFPQAVLDEWWAECDARFEIKRATLEHDVYQHGTYTFAYGFEPGAVDLTNAAMLEALQRLPQYTGWSTWLVTDGELAPYPAEGRIECSLGGVAVEHADFWRAAPTGLLYLRRGYDEDVEFDANKAFSVSLPIWRLGETLLHVRDLGRSLGLREHIRVRVRARWSGLAGRVLHRWPDGPMTRVKPAVSHTEQVVSQTLLELGDLTLNLPATVDALTRELFESFGFHHPAAETIAHHLERLENRR